METAQIKTRVAKNNDQCHLHATKQSHLGDIGSNPAKPRTSGATSGQSKNPESNSTVSCSVAKWRISVEEVDYLCVLHIFDNRLHHHKRLY